MSAFSLLPFFVENIHQLARRVQADVFWWSRYGVIDNVHVVLDVSIYSTHDDVGDSPTRVFHGAPLGRGSFADRSAEVLDMRRGRWSLSTPSPIHLNQFALWDEEFTMPYVMLREQRVFRERKWVRSFYEMYSVYDQLRGFFFDRYGNALGTVSFWRCGSGPGFGQREKQLLNAELELIRQVFPGEMEQQLAAADYFVLGVDGEVSWSSPDLDWWLTEARLRQIEEHVRKNSERLVLSRCVVEPTPLLNGQVLCKIKPIERIRATPMAGANQQQHDIALLLGSGATSNEIAELLGISVNSVRASIRSMYKKFGVSARVELIAALHRSSC